MPNQNLKYRVDQTCKHVFQGATYVNSSTANRFLV